MYKNILLCSKYPNFCLEIEELLTGLDYQLTQVGSEKELGGLDPQYKPAIVIIEVAEDKAELLAIYDEVYTRYRAARIIVTYKNSLPFDVDQIGGRKQNLTFVQRPFENELLVSYILEYAPIEINPKKLRMEHMNPIRISDIRPSDKFNFDLYFYMPANKKLLLYRRKNSQLTEEQIKKFGEFNVFDLFVRKNEMHAVQDYLSKKLSRTFGDKSLPLTEKRRKLQKEVRDVFGTFFNAGTFDYQKSRVALDTCKKWWGSF